MKTKYLATSIAFAIAMTGIGILWGLITLTNNLFESEPDQPANTSSAEIIALPSAEEIENRINAHRSEKGLPLLADSAILDQAAQVRADGMCATNDWSHAKDWEVLNQYYAYSYAGENLYYGSLQKEQELHAIQGWLASPTHLENIVGNYTESGTAVKSCPGFQGSPTAVIVTNYFGVPR